MPTAFGDHTACHRHRKTRLCLCPKEVHRLLEEQIHKRFYYFRQVTRTPRVQGTRRGRDARGCPLSYRKALKLTEAEPEGPSRSC